MEKLDLSKLTVVPIGTTRRRQSFDLHYVELDDGKGRWRFSNRVFVELSLDSYGVSIQKYADGRVLLSVQSESNSEHMKRRGTNKKGKEFTNHNLRRFLDRADMGGENDFALVPVGVSGGSAFYQIISWDEKVGITNGGSVPLNVPTPDEDDDTEEEIETTSEDMSEELKEDLEEDLEEESDDNDDNEDEDEEWDLDDEDDEDEDFNPFDE